MRKKRVPAKVGRLLLGEGLPVRVQTMLKGRISSRKTLGEFNDVVTSGAEIVRVALPDLKETQYLKPYLGRGVPLVADVHFDWRIALQALEMGVEKVRINPSNIGVSWKVEEVVKTAADRGAALRIGANIGSLKNIRSDDPLSRAAALISEVEKELDFLEKYRFRNTVISFKADDIETTYQANKIFSRRYRFPLHLGLTATGDRESGKIKSSVLLGRLLAEGIGNTIRVSLTASSVEEVETGWEILFAFRLRRPQYEIISCPTCGRCGMNLAREVQELKRVLGPKKESASGRTLKIAIMGCEVNGPGEARLADFGFVAGKNGWAYFEKGEVKKRVPQDQMKSMLCEKIASFSNT